MISFIYFDVGGVVAKDFSYSDKWNQLREELKIPEMYEQEFTAVFRKREKELCTSVSVDEVIAPFAKKHQITLPRNISLLDGFVKRFERNESLLAVIDEIKLLTRVGLLTNMYVGMLDSLTKEAVVPQNLWDIVIDSSRVGYCKPDKQIFEIAQEKVGYGKDEVLFVDNNEANISAADAFGWQTYFYDASDYERSTKEFKKYIGTYLLNK